MKRADLHAEIKELRRQRSLLARHCVELRRLQAIAVGGPDSHRAAEDEERAWIAKTVLRPGERL